MPVRTWSIATGFVRRMHLYHSKNRLSTSTSNISSSAKDGLEVRPSISTTSSPWKTSRQRDVGAWTDTSTSSNVVATHRENRSSPRQGQWILERFVPSGLWSPTLTVDETKSRFCTRTRSRIFGRTNFIHFFVGSSYAVKSACVCIAVTSLGHRKGTTTLTYP